jgi:DNA-binding transcriptional LysR family regulator
LRRSIGGTVPPIDFDPQITLRQLRYFDRLRTSASLSDAARRLCVVQPALTVQLKGLEREAGAQLVERQGRSAQQLRMTSDGQQLATISAWTLSTVDDMERQLAAWSRRRARHLRLGVPLGLGALPTIALGLARATEEVQQRYPMLSVELIEARHQELVTMLHQRTLQVALLELRAPNVRQTPLLAPDRLVLVCAKDSELVPSGSVTLAELRHLRLVLPRPGGAVRMLLDEASAAGGFQLAPNVECDSVVLALRHVLFLGLAAVVTAAEAEAIVNDREFEVHPIEHQHLERRVTLAAARGEPLRDAARAMMVALRGSLSTTAVS